jgi:hypothetical protein
MFLLVKLEWENHAGIEWHRPPPNPAASPPLRVVTDGERVVGNKKGLNHRLNPFV